MKHWTGLPWWVLCLPLALTPTLPEAQMGQEPTAVGGPGKVADIVHPSQIPFVALDAKVATMRIDWTVKPEQFTTYTRDALLAWVKTGHRALVCNECVELFGGKASTAFRGAGIGGEFPITLLTDSHPLMTGVRQLAMDFIHASEGDLPPDTAPFAHWVLPMAPFLLVGPSAEVLVRSAQPYEQGSYLAAAFVYPLEQGEVLFWHRCFDYGRFDGPTLKRNLEGYIRTFATETPPEAFDLPPAVCPACQHEFKRDLQKRGSVASEAKTGKLAALTDPSQLKALTEDPEVATIQIAPNLTPDQFPTEARDALILWVSSGHRAYGCGAAMRLFGLAIDSLYAPEHMYSQAPYRCVVKMPEDYHPIVTGVRRVQLLEVAAELVRVAASEPVLFAPAGGRGPNNYLQAGEPGYLAMVTLAHLGEGEVLYWSPSIDLGSLDGPILRRNGEAYLKTFPQPRLGPDEETCPECGSLVKL